MKYILIAALTLPLSLFGQVIQVGTQMVDRAACRATLDGARLTLNWTQPCPPPPLAVWLAGGLWNGSSWVVTNIPEPIAPQYFTAPIVAPSIVVSPALDGHGYELAVDPANAMVVPVERLSMWQSDSVVSQRLAGVVASNTAKRTTWQTIKTSAAYSAMTNQLAQYDTHYPQATNSVNAVIDPATRAALAKILQSLDDCHDALLKSAKVLKQSVDNQ